jgi:hypothetical protein
MPTVAVAAIFCLYDACARTLRAARERERRLHHRVAYMLWVMANREEEDAKASGALSGLGDPDGA